MFIHAGRQAALAVTAHGMGGHRQYRQVGKTRVCTHLLGGGKAIQHGHLQIHQHQVVMVFADFLDCLLAIDSHIGVQPDLLQKGQCHHAVEFDIVHQQNACMPDGTEVMPAVFLTLAVVTVGAGQRGTHQGLQHGIVQR